MLLTQFPMDEQHRTNNTGTSEVSEIERNAMVRNRYNYPTPPIRDIKGKEIHTRNNETLMETSLAESQTDSYFPTKWPNGHPKQKDVSYTHIQRGTITKLNQDRRTALERSVKSEPASGPACSGPTRLD